jgi:hypothetical protein
MADQEPKTIFDMDEAEEARLDAKAIPLINQATRLDPLI